MSIDWKQVAKDNNMSYKDFGQELIETTMAHMSNEMVRSECNEMIVTNSNIVLSCRILDEAEVDKQ